MKEIERKYSSHRIIKGKDESYQGVSVTQETYEHRHYVTVELESMQRWRSVEEVAEYLRWCADEIETLKQK